MTLLASLTPAGAALTGRLKWIAGDPIGAGSLTGLIEPTGHTNWVLANGAVLSNTGKYASLYAMVGTKFGAAGTLPSIIDGRVPIPKGATNFLTAGVSSGEINHVLALTEFPNHTHNYNDNDQTGVGFGHGTNQANIDGFNPSNFYGGTRTTNPTGGGGSHNNMPPYLVVGFVLVKL